MNKDDFKYVIADFSSTQIGARYSYEEILMNDRVPLKFQSILTIYILREMKALDPSLDEPEKITIAEHLLNIRPGNLIYDTYKRLKLHIRVAIPMNKGRYKIKNMKFDDFIDYVSDNDSKDYMIQEINISNLALMSFSI